MGTTAVPISDMLVTVKSREVQRALLAEMRDDRRVARRHFLAGAHLELVLAADYEQAGEEELAVRSHLSAASCLWRAGEYEQAQHLFEELRTARPTQTQAVQQVQTELARDYPPLVS